MVKKGKQSDADLVATLRDELSATIGAYRQLVSGNQNLAVQISFLEKIVRIGKGIASLAPEIAGETEPVNLSVIRKYLNRSLDE